MDLVNKDIRPKDIMTEGFYKRINYGHGSWL